MGFTSVGSAALKDRQGEGGTSQSQLLNDHGSSCSLAASEGNGRRSSQFFPAGVAEDMCLICLTPEGRSDGIF